MSRRGAKFAEAALLFGVGPAALALAPPWLVLPAIWAGSGCCYLALRRDPEFPREVLRRRPTAAEVGAVFARGAVGLALMAAAVGWLRPAALFAFPRQRPLFFAVVLVGYPILSAWPQEIVFRAFFLHRYRDLWRRTPLCLASAIAFAWAHVVMRNALAIGLSFLGGLLFARTYTRGRSLPLVALEHALWGDMLFAVGLGSFFYAGARATH